MTKKIILLVAVALLLPQTGAFANSFGIGGGFSATPDQLLFSGQAELGKFGQSGRFVPSAQIGFGDNATVLAFNADALWYLSNLPDTELRFYLSTGPSLAVISPDGFSSLTEIGLSLNAGLRIPRTGTGHYNIEARFGIGDIPDFKAVIHWMF